MATVQIEMKRNNYNDGWSSDRFIRMEGERNSYYSAAISDKGMNAEAPGKHILHYAFIFPRALVIDNYGGSSESMNRALEVKRGDRITLITGITRRTFTVTDGGWLSDPKLVEVK